MGWVNIDELMKKPESELSFSILKKPIAKDGWTIAHSMAYRGYKFTDKAVLKLATTEGRTVAHVMAWQGHEFTDKEVLALADESGWTVAHTTAYMGGKIADKEVLKLATKSRRWTVAHEIAKHWRWYWYKHREILNWIRKKEILKLSDNNGWTVAHEMAQRRCEFKDKEILKLADKDGWTVAHEMAYNGWKISDKEILKLANKRGWTVAHVMARQGHRFTDKEILKLVDEVGLTVAFVMQENSGKSVKKEVIEALKPRELASLIRTAIENSTAGKLCETTLNSLSAEVESGGNEIVKKFNEVAFKTKKKNESCVQSAKCNAQKFFVL